MRRLRNRILPPGSSRRRRTIVWLSAIGVFLAVLLAIPPAWEYSNSVSFCGTSCHTMPPELNTYLVSPHARVLCVDCHIGRGLILEQAIRKSGHMRLLFATLTNSYEYPIRVSTMRPARETCELCHFPEKFSDDSLRVTHRFGTDEQNESFDVYLLMHTGGGSHREGLGQGIHWHVENLVEYIATDELEQDIPWVRVTEVDGSTTIYEAEDSTLNSDALESYDIHVMDCITCHNRISHLLDNPRNLVDEALYRGDISPEIPYIRAQAVELLTMTNANVEGDELTEEEAAEQARERITLIDALEDYYSEDYPQFYTDNTQLVETAIATLQQLYTANTYPVQHLDWQTHPNNVGHRDWPGCFRCHDGEHFSPAGEAIRLECNLCHSIPQVVSADDIEPTLPLTTGLEPSSHLDSTWISRHHNEFDDSCGNCHTLANPGGTTDTSFCSNSQCHGIDWRYGGFDAPTLAIELGNIQEVPETPPVEIAPEGPISYETLQPLFESKCGECHGDNPTLGLQVTTYDGLMAGSDNGPVVVPGSPDDSVIVEVQSGRHFARFSQQEMGLLRAWIEAGAPATEADITAD